MAHSYNSCYSCSNSTYIGYYVEYESRKWHESLGKSLWHIRVIRAIRVQILRTLVVVLNTNLANSTIFWGKEQRCICGIYYLSFFVSEIYKILRSCSIPS